jgi:hypothetical protein
MNSYQQGHRLLMTEAETIDEAQASGTWIACSHGLRPIRQ